MATTTSNQCVIVLRCSLDENVQHSIYYTTVYSLLMTWKWPRRDLRQMLSQNVQTVCKQLWPEQRQLSPDLDNPASMCHTKAKAAWHESAIDIMIHFHLLHMALLADLHSICLMLLDLQNKIGGERNVEHTVAGECEWILRCLRKSV